MSDEYGLVSALHMQDATMSIELRALIAIVSTYPRDGWMWRTEKMMSLTGWSKRKYSRVMEEAKSRGLLRIERRSDDGSPELVWSIWGIPWGGAL